MKRLFYLFLIGFFIIAQSSSFAVDVGSMDVKGDITITGTVDGVDVSNLSDGQIKFVATGNPIATNETAWGRIPYDCTITAVEMTCDQSATISVDIWKDTYANYPPTDTDSITASAVPTITADTKNLDETLTGWTTSLSKGDYLKFNVDSNDNAEKVVVILKVNKS